MAASEQAINKSSQKKNKKKKLTHYDLIRRTNELLPEYQPPMIRRVGEAKLSERARLAKRRALGDNRWRVIIIPICMLRQNFFLFFFFLITPQDVNVTASQSGCIYFSAA